MLNIFYLLKIGTLIHVIQGSDVMLNLTNDGPTLLDAPITFYADLYHLSNDAFIGEMFKYEWKDNVDHKITVKECGMKCNLTKSYPSIKTRARKYEMKLKVKNNDSKLIVRKQTTFHLTDTIPGMFVVTQKGNPHNPVQRSLLSKLVATFVPKIHDPEGYLSNALIYYSWHVNGTVVTHNKTMNYTFLTAGLQYISVDMYALKPKSVVKVGNFMRRIRVGDSIKIGINGKTVLKHGQITKLNVTCTGSAPFKYCWEIFNPNESIPLKFHCVGPIVTTVCQFPVIRYMSKSGSYKLLVHISNDISSETSQKEISILDETKEGQLTAILIPVVCSIFAIAIIVWGIGYFVHTRNRYKIEVADFDFQKTSDLVYRTFFQRLKSSVVEVVGCHYKYDDDTSNLLNGDVSPSHSSYRSIHVTPSKSSSVASISEAVLDDK